MALTLEDVRRVLSPDEPNYARAQQLGPEALPLLRQLVAQSGSSVAGKAAYLAGLIGTEAGAEVVAHAALNPDPAVRVAAAAVAKELALEPAAPILNTLLADHDRGVRLRALRSAAARLTPALRQSIQKMAETEKDVAIRKEAISLLGGPQ